MGDQLQDYYNIPSLILSSDKQPANTMKQRVAGQDLLVSPEQKSTCHQLSRWHHGSATTSLVHILALLVFSSVMFPTVTSRSLDAVLNGSTNPYPVLVNLTLVKNAREKGALCVDGTPPGYHFMKGFGSGADNWLIFLEGGGWCNDLESCNERKTTDVGSTNHMDHQVAFTGILSNLPSYNPAYVELSASVANFFNWNKVKVRYCDGASFSGDVENTEQTGTTLYFRGERIWKAVMEELLHNGLAGAKKALLTGCSAGGLATYIHCDDFKALLPYADTVKCMADGGFFLDVKDISGKRSFRQYYSDVVQLQDVGKRLPNCVSGRNPGKCFFPREIIKTIRTPVFILNSAYDSWQINNVLAPDSSDPSKSWANCKSNLKNCNSSQMKTLEGFREALLYDIRNVEKKQDWGIFVASCFVHCQSQADIAWNSPVYERINNKSPAKSVGDWYFDRRKVEEIDGLYPSNPTCLSS